MKVKLFSYAEDYKDWVNDFSPEIINVVVFDGFIVATYKKEPLL